MFLVSQPSTAGMMTSMMTTNHEQAPSALLTQSSHSGNECPNMYTKLQDTLEPLVSPDGKAKIARIKAEVQSLTQVEKFLLYNSLPTGLVTEDQSRLTPTSCLPSSNRKEQAEAFTWIKSHLEEHGDVCLPKSQVYDEYRNFCQQHELRFLCNADFGKMMKQVFPDINTRRLGQRGQSRYFYGGLRKKLDHTPPTLPELEIQSKTMEIDNSTLGNEVFKASCLLVCEWADKLLEGKFSGIQEVARHLVANMLVNTKSVPAFTVLADMQENSNGAFKSSALFNSQCSVSGDKHKETNMLLQQKLHKNKLIQEQKEKLQAMKDEAAKLEGSTTSATQNDRVTPSTPLRKSATPSRMSRTPKQCSTKPNPQPSQSPLKLVQGPTSVSAKAQEMCKNQVPTTKMASNQDSSIGDQKCPSLSAVMTTLSSAISMQNSQTASVTSVMSVSMATTTSVTMATTVPMVSTTASMSDLFQSVSRATSGPIQCIVTTENGLRQVRSLGTLPKESSNSGLNMSDHLTDGQNQCIDAVLPSRQSESNLKKILLAGKKSMEGNCTAGVEVMVVNNDIIMEDAASCLASSSAAETPYSEMETDSEDARKHVRKIDFDTYITQQSNLANVLGLMAMGDAGKEEERKNVTIATIASSVSYSGGVVSNSRTSGGAKGIVSGICFNADGKNEPKSENHKLSKSAETMGIKMLLENKSLDDSSLNKSKNKLFVNQSTISGRSAFVPFSQSRKENIALTKSSTIAVLQPVSASDAVNASIGMKMQTGSKQVKPLNTRPVESILKLIPSSVALSHKDQIVLAPITLSPGTGTSSIITNMSQLSAKDTLTIVTSSTSLAKPVSTEPVLSSFQHSPSFGKQYIPIQPKPMNISKGTPVKEPKGESHTNDKRPVAQLLKEKRAREQAEAMLKMHGNPASNSLQSVGEGTHSSATALQRAGNIVPSKELLFLLNKQTQNGAQIVVSNQLLPILNQTTTTVPATSTVAAGAPASVEIGKVSTANETRFAETNNIRIQRAVSSEGSNRDGICTTVESLASKPSNVQISFAVLHQDSSTLEEVPSDAAGPLSGDSGKSEMQRGGATPPCQLNTPEDRFDEIFIETPAKVAKLKITNPSPFRPESACSIGRETPSRNSRLSDLSLSRPESACSLGRETPSGTRKRKSSDFHPRRDFKRLNSTGDEGEEFVLATKLGSGAVTMSPGADILLEETPRRTQSCTYGIDKSITATKSPQAQKVFISRDALQSPDISCLEMEALIESYSNQSDLQRPHKTHINQSTSVGVNAKSMQQSHQKLLKQKQQLDRQLNSYFLKENTVSAPSQKSQHQVRSHSSIGNIAYLVKYDRQTIVTSSNDGATAERQLVRDSISDAFRKELDAIASKSQDIDGLEPSGLPNDVVDFIIEKSEEKHNSMSDSFEQQSKMDEEEEVKQDASLPNFGLQRFMFEMKEQNLNQSSDNDPLQVQIFQTSANSVAPQSLLSPSPCPMGTDGTNHSFTIPKVPALTTRPQVAARPESLSSNTRCQSLPTFTSPIQSPMSPSLSPSNRNANSSANGHLQRASSMSPRTGHADIISPVGGMISPLRRMEVRENHPITLNIHPANKQMIGFGGKPVMYDDRGKPSYLASIQHTLQKPSVNHQQKIYREQSFEKIITQNQTVPVSSEMHTQENTLSNTPEYYLTNSRISDSGYHSTGPSPILNSTPISSTDLDHSQDRNNLNYRQTVTESPITMSTELTGKGLTIIPHQQGAPQMGGENQMTTQFVLSLQGDVGKQASSLNSSTNSAFTPINSSKEHRYVAPIKPIVTLPESQLGNGNQAMVTSVEYTDGGGNSLSDKDLTVTMQSNDDVEFPDKLYLDMNAGEAKEESMMLSPGKTYDPPSYETAVKSLRRIDNGHVGMGSALSDNGSQGYPSLEQQFQMQQIQQQQQLRQQMLHQCHQQQQQQQLHLQQNQIAKNRVVNPMRKLDNSTSSGEQISFLDNLGNSDAKSTKAIGPFASKLVELSRQTLQPVAEKNSSTNQMDWQQRSLPSGKLGLETQGEVYGTIVMQHDGAVTNQMQSIPRLAMQRNLAENQSGLLDQGIGNEQIIATNSAGSNEVQTISIDAASIAGMSHASLANFLASHAVFSQSTIPSSTSSSTQLSSSSSASSLLSPSSISYLQNKDHNFSQNPPSFNLLSLSSSGRQFLESTTSDSSNCHGNLNTASMQFPIPDSRMALSSNQSGNPSLMSTNMSVSMSVGNIFDIDSETMLSPSDSEMDLTDVNSVGLSDDMNLTLESLKDMDGQYHLDSSALYGSDQLLGDLDLFSQ